MDKFRRKWEVKIVRQLIPFIMWQFLVRKCYSPKGLHISYIQLESINDISSIFDGTINLNDLGKFPEFIIKLWLVIPFFKTCIITRSMFLFFLSSFFIVPFIEIPLNYFMYCHYFNFPKNDPNRISIVIH